MSADSEGKRPRRRPLSRSRKLGSRRRRGTEDEAEEEENDSGDSPEEGEDGSAAETSLGADSDQTLPVNKIPSPGGSGSPVPDSVPPPPTAERIAKIKGGARRFGVDFSRFLMGIGESAHQQGLDFNQKVVKPFSHALFEAAICLALIAVTGVFGVMFGRYLKTVTAEGSKVVSFQDREVKPGQKIDESFFSQGFDSKELHQRANRVLDEHLGALKGSEFVKAYDLLSPAWKAQLSYPTFERGYLSTRVLAYNIGKVETLDAQRIRLRAELQVEEGGSEKLYSAVYIAILTPDGWRLDGGTFK